MRRILAAVALSLALVANANAGGQRTIVIGSTDPLTISGCGYSRTGAEVYVFVYREADDTELLGQATGFDSNGCFSLTANLSLPAGDYEAETFLIKGLAGPGNYNYNHPAAYLDFTVSP